MYCTSVVKSGIEARPFHIVAPDLLGKVGSSGENTGQEVDPIWM